MDFFPGMKVVVKGDEENGFSEVLSYPDKTGKIRLKYFSSPVDTETISIDQECLTYPILPNQTKCFLEIDDHICYGRIIICRDEANCPRKYFLKLPNEIKLQLFNEDEFHVRSYLKNLSPVDVLSEFAQETPFFFHQRYSLLTHLLKQHFLCGGIPGIASAKIEFFDHQVEIAKRVLQDPKMRYLLADEVGLGKTIETGIIMRQIKLDSPNCRMRVFVPKVIVNQWREELDLRFCLEDVQVLAHDEMLTQRNDKLDLVVIDEAHRIVTAGEAPEQKIELYEAANRIAQNTENLLLLSATPILHQDAEMLALLQLLDPQSYNIDKLDSFSELLQNRQKLGQAFLAFTKAKLPALLKRHGKKIMELLPDDHIIKELVAQMRNTDNSQIILTADAIRAHISESYRIHRRMLRTRRSWLMEDFGLGSRNVAEKEIKYELNKDTFNHLWERLEDWRIEMASSDAAMYENNHLQLINNYIALAEAISSDHSRFQLLIEQEIRKGISTIQKEILEDMLSHIKNISEENDRISLLSSIILDRLNNDTKEYKYLIFCSTQKNVKNIDKRLSDILEIGQWEIVHEQLNDSERDNAIARFRDDLKCRFLVADTVIEEGVNLQFAEGLVLYDLPWSPLRIEQRLGRVDRINRVRDIPCRVILTLESESLSLDNAWYEVLTKGFGLYEGSLSDLQFLIDKKLPELMSTSFWGGPSALVGAIPDLKQDIEKERERIAEQDVIDGMHFTRSRGSELRENLDDADIDAINFSKAIMRYLDRNLKFKMVWTGKNTFHYKLIDDEPLLPLFRLETLMRNLLLPSTHNRNTVLRNPSLQLFRPGNDTIEDIRHLINWDDRGRAFMLWRQKDGIVEPMIIFRVILHIYTDVEMITDSQEIKRWHPIARNGLLRLIRSWLPEYLHELFLDESGESVPAEIQEFCLEPYKKFKEDTNLGGKRAHFFRELVGDSQWRKKCEYIASKCFQSIEADDVVRDFKKQALRSANKYFSLMAAQLEVRAKSGFEPKKLVKKEKIEQKTLHSLVQEIIEKPCVSIDTMGVYILSETPFWLPEDE